MNRFCAGLVAAGILLAPRTIMAAGSPDSGSSVSAATTSATTTNDGIPPGVGTQPVVGSASSQTPLAMAPDPNTGPKHFTITATLREEYDSNVYTAYNNEISSFKTDISPSLLFDYPTANSDFSARYTFGLDLYYNSQADTEMSHDFVARYQHAFSERFNFDVAEQFRYSSEPSFFSGNGTLYRNGSYITNTVNADFSAQWTPLVSTVTTYSNTIVNYESSSVGTEQNSVENIGSQSIGFAILPKINLIFGGIIDDISYQDITRGYTSYTGNTGVDWQALPSLSLGVRIGGSVTDGQNQQATVSPYASLTLHWKLGERSSLSFDYSHSTVPSDVVVSDGQTADRFSASFRYDILPSLTAHLQGILTHGEYPATLIAPGTISAFSENDYAIDTGLSYHLNPHLDLEGGYTFSGVSSDLNFRDYSRSQVYLGVRGTY